MRCRRRAWTRLAAMARDGISAAVTMWPYEDDIEHGLVYGYVLDGEGGARKIRRNELEVFDLRPQESFWLHWDCSVPRRGHGCGKPAG